MSLYKYAQPSFLDGSQTQLNIDVSAKMLDARQAIWMLYDPSSNEILGAITVIDSATVQLNFPAAPVSGNYMLVGLA